MLQRLRAQCSLLYIYIILCYEIIEKGGVSMTPKKEKSNKEKFLAAPEQLKRARAAGIIVRDSVPKIRKALKVSWSEAYQIAKLLAADRPLCSVPTSWAAGTWG